MKPNKVIFIDWNLFVHRAIYGCLARNELRFATFMCARMIFACLKRIEIHKEDLIILAVDSPLGSWRKDVDSNYKANRKELRAKAGIDWSIQYAEFNALLENFEVSTSFHIVCLHRLEADDIISYGVRHFKDSECVVISSDTDYEQLVKFPNVKLFSPVTKKYKIITENPHVLIDKKIKKEKTDNLITPIKSLADYKKRDLLVNLLKLPEYVEEIIKIELDKLEENKIYDVELFRFGKLRYELENLFLNESKDVVTMLDSVKKKKKNKKVQSLF